LSGLRSEFSRAAETVPSAARRPCCPTAATKLPDDK